VVDAELEFVKDEASKVTAAITHQNGRDPRGARISDTVEQPHEISVSPEILARYVGVYTFSPGFDVTITSRTSN
jgi:hypothetical protein